KEVITESAMSHIRSNKIGRVVPRWLSGPRIKDSQKVEHKYQETTQEKETNRGDFYIRRRGSRDWRR
ncbi:hypothetical protein, partial [Serratia marcescens]|uniref:hypothetical protein n=1 Tax=Serratia marcescens TaxID=615 RepID=UPI002813255C